MDSDLPPTFDWAVEQFNHGDFYGCHDTLESLWMEAPPELRNFYQGILQIAVACYHLGHGNRRGAMLLLGEGISRLRAYPEDFGGVGVSSLVGQSRTLLDHLRRVDLADLGSLTLPTVTQVR